MPFSLPTREGCVIVSVDEDGRGDGLPQAARKAAERIIAKGKARRIF
jgi:hypothetical protein